MRLSPLIKSPDEDPSQEQNESAAKGEVRDGTDHHGVSGCFGTSLAPKEFACILFVRNQLQVILQRVVRILQGDSAKIKEVSMRQILLLWISLTIFLTGCGSLPLYTHQNVYKKIDWVAEQFKDSQYSAVKGADIVDWEPFEKQDAFIGVAISGGGSRAANFGVAVLRELENLGILSHVTAISSVSGGSLAAAYYGLYRETDEWADDAIARKRFATDLFWSWQWRLFYPHNLFRNFFTGFDRSDLMADVFDNVFFNGKTFADLPETGPRIFINATNAVSGQPFHFSNQFFKCIESDLKSYPISHAVMASGAFPLVFQNVTLRDYFRSWGRRGPGRGTCDLGNTVMAPMPQSHEIVFDDIKDADALANLLLNDGSTVTAYFRDILGPKGVTFLRNRVNTVEVATTLRKDLNVLVNRVRLSKEDDTPHSLYDPEIFKDVKLSSTTKRLLQQEVKEAAPDMQSDHWREVNRRILADVFPDQIRSVSRDRYIHLFDGGPSENLGIETVREAAMYYFANYFAEAPSNVLSVDPSGNVFLGTGTVEFKSNKLIGYGAPLPTRKAMNKPSDGAPLPKREDKRAPGCLIISIDAYANPLESDLLYQADSRRGWIDFVFDRNAMNATDTLLTLRRDDVLRRLDIKTNTSYDTALHSVDLLTVTNHGESNRGRCDVWHISFSRLYDLHHAYERRRDPDDHELFKKGDPELTRKAKLVHFRLADAINRIETHYKLKGPKGCSPDQLQDFLYYAAHALVHDDARTLERLYPWFDQRKLKLKERPDSNNPLLKELPIVKSGDIVKCAK